MPIIWKRFVPLLLTASSSSWFMHLDERKLELVELIVLIQESYMSSELRSMML